MYLIGDGNTVVDTGFGYGEIRQGDIFRKIPRLITTYHIRVWLVEDKRLGPGGPHRL